MGMSVLFAAQAASNVSLSYSAERCCLLEALLTDVRQAFQTIEYVLVPNSRTVNAQALAIGRSRHVRLYGGFVFHPLIGVDSLIFALLHETGHHLAPGPRFASDPMLACDCAADCWAITNGVRTLQHCSGRAFDLQKALNEVTIIAASSEVRERPRKARKRPSRAHQCWAANWRDRRMRLSGARKLEVAERCYIWSS